jgi:hypothetical protein
LKPQIVMAEVFISYRHESEPHRTRVRTLGEQLQAEGINVVLDQFFLDANPGGPDEGWPTWSKTHAANTEKILIVASPGWFRCYDGKEVPGSGLGAAVEGRLISQRVYNESGVNRIARIVLFDSADRSGISLDLQGYHSFHAVDDFDGIVRWVKGSVAAAVPFSAPIDWPIAAPDLEWHPADCEPVREAFTRLLTRDTPHRVVLICGPSLTGKSHLTRYLLGRALDCQSLACGRLDLKSGADLDDEFARFVLHLGVDEAVREVAGASPRTRLEAIFNALRKLARPTLLLFDTFEQGGEWARWVEEYALLAIPRAAWLRLLVTGQRVPHPAGTAWESWAAPIIQLQPLGWEPWYQFGKRHRSDLTPEFIQQVHTLSRGNHSLLSQLLSPET